MKHTSTRGFTLIEILIVVAIIGILASTVLVGLGTTTRRGRDARRISDLKQVQTGLELYFSANGQYPSNSNWAGLQAALKGSNIGVSNVPDDPNSPSRSYDYVTDVNGTTYVLRADLEDGSNPALQQDIDTSDEPVGINSFDCDESGTHNYYCVAL